MRRIIIITALVAISLTTMAAKKKVNNTQRSGQSSAIRIEPTDWYVGMKNPTVQLMISGRGIRDAVK